jgi:drug/metabolite transporter (DMT)-like permease
MNQRIKVFAALTGTMLFWAFSFVWTKVAFTVWTPISTIWLRLVISALFIFGYLALTRRLEPLRKKDIKWLLVLSFFQPFLSFMGESNGLHYFDHGIGYCEYHSFAGTNSGSFVYE